MATEPTSPVNLSPAANAGRGASVLQTLQTLVTALTTTKAGWRTSEFWLTVAGALFPVLAAAAGALPPSWAAVSMPIIAVIYQLIRVAVKSDQHGQVATAAQCALDHLTEVTASLPSAVDQIAGLRRAAEAAGDALKTSIAPAAQP